MALSAAQIAHLDGRNKKSGRFENTRRAESPVNLGGHLSVEESRLSGLMNRWPGAAPATIDTIIEQLGKHDTTSHVLAVAEESGQPLRLVRDIDSSITRPERNIQPVAGVPVNPTHIAILEGVGIPLKNATTLPGGLTINRKSGNIKVLIHDDGEIDFPGNEEYAYRHENPLDQWNEILTGRVDQTAANNTLGGLFNEGNIEPWMNEETGDAHFHWTREHRSVRITATPDGEVEIIGIDNASTHEMLNQVMPHSSGADPETRIKAQAILAREQMIWHEDVEQGRHHLRTGIRDHGEFLQHRERLHKSLKQDSKTPVYLTVTRGLTAVQNTTGNTVSMILVRPDGTSTQHIDGNKVSGFDPKKRNQQKLVRIVESQLDQITELAQASWHGVDKD